MSTETTADKFVTLTVTVRLDPLPGAFHDTEDAQQRVKQILMSSIPHYRPFVGIMNPAYPQVTYGMTDWDGLRLIHLRDGHKSFVDHARYEDKSLTFVKNVCTDVSCPEGWNI